MNRSLLIIAALLTPATAPAEIVYRGQFHLSTSTSVTFGSTDFLVEVDVLADTGNYFVGFTYFGPRFSLPKGTLYALLGTETDNAGQVAITTACWHIWQVSPRFKATQVAELYLPITGQRQTFAAHMGKWALAGVELGYRAEGFWVEGKLQNVALGPVFEHEDIRLWLAADVASVSDRRAFIRVSKFF